MPRVDDLPDDLKNLAYRNAVEVSHARWSSDMSLLITALRNHVAVTAVSSRENESQLPSSRPESRRYRSWFLFVSIPLFLAISGFYILRRLYLPAHPSGPPVKEVITGQVSHPPDLSGVWRQTNPQTNVEKPDPPMRLRITQQDSMVAVYLTYGTSFPGEAIGKARIEKDRATWTLKGGCGGSSTFVVYLSGDVLFYEVTDTFPVPCGGHPAGVEHRPVAEFRRIQGVTG